MQILANIEAAQRTNRLFSALKEGNAAMTQLQRQVKLEDVEQLNEETAEAAEYQQRVRELLEQSLSAQDDADALEELEKIQVGTWLPAHDDLNICCLFTDTFPSPISPDRHNNQNNLYFCSQMRPPPEIEVEGIRSVAVTWKMSADVNIIGWQAAQEEEEAAALPSVPAPAVEEATPQPELPAVPTVSSPTPTQHFSHGSCVVSQGQSLSFSALMQQSAHLVASCSTRSDCRQQSSRKPRRNELQRNPWLRSLYSPLCIIFRFCNDRCALVCACKIALGASIVVAAYYTGSNQPLRIVVRY